MAEPTVKEFVYPACCELDARRALKMCEEDLTYHGYEFYKVHEHPDEEYIELKPTFAPWHKNHEVYYFCWKDMCSPMRGLEPLRRTQKGRPLQTHAEQK